MEVLATFLVNFLATYIELYILTTQLKKTAITLIGMYLYARKYFLFTKIEKIILNIFKYKEVKQMNEDYKLKVVKFLISNFSKTSIFNFYSL